MKISELRKLYVDYFVERGHKLVDSSPLLPHNDPTLLFTTAGMVQFKDLWAGLVKPLPYKKAVSIQKCLRAGGKGSDLENVGKTLRHHTFFEMLGNFSFGDYFKLEAIQYGWDFSTNVLKLPKEKIYASVYKDDEEAYNIWKDVIGLDPKRIVRLGDKDNFWGPAGDMGACGPCSELHIDMGAERSCGKPDCGVGCSCERYLEFWNMVFPQFNQQKDGSRLPLENRGIDTGMGLERLGTIIQGVGSPYETNEIAVIVEAVCQALKVKYKDSRVTTMSVNVIADHMRTLTFTLTEGIIPSNEGRGYVLRKILRRALRHSKKLGMDKPFMNELVDVVVQVMGDTYPEIKENSKQVAKIIRYEEERFLSTLNQGLEILESVIADLKGKNGNIISGEDAFKLYDTYGFPVDLTLEVAEEHGLEVNKIGFEQKLKEQKELAKKSWKGAGLDAVDSILIDILEEHGSTDFVGYETDTSQTEVIGILDKENKRIDKAATGQDITVILKQTPFYAESGGQVGDIGYIKTDSGKIIITDTQKTKSDIFLHKGKIIDGNISVGELAEAKIDTENRLATMRNHSATHLLQAALKQVVGKHITQSGSFVSPQILRFDFTHMEAITDKQLTEIELLINGYIMKNSAVCKEVMSKEEAKKTGAIAPFGEKYGEKVRVITMGDVSSEFCGGTHLDYTGQVGSFIILSEASIASGIRRIEALTGLNAVKHIQAQMNIISNLSKTLSISPREISGRIEAFQNEIKQVHQELDKLRQKESSSKINEILESPKKIGDINLITHKFEGIGMKELRAAADIIKDKAQNTVAVIGSVIDDKVALIAVSTKEIQGKIPAGDLVKEVAKIVDGSGGGRADMAQAGGKIPEKLDEALNNVEMIILNMLKK